MSLTLTPPQTLASEDQTFTITGLSWEQYAAIGDALGDQPNLRMLFLDGSLTFLSPELIHEWSEDWLDTIIKAIVRGCRIELTGIGSTTLRKLGLAGLEGDRVYYLHANVARLHGLKKLDLTLLPPPDLAIEVENSNKADKAMLIYAHLGVPEVWRFDVRRDRLGFWGLDANGIYESIQSSRHFPFLTAADILPQLNRAAEVGSFTQWADELEAWVHAVILPRLDQP